jgi:hypothetical protein
MLKDFTPKFATIATWVALSGMAERSVYEELGRGNIKAVKVRRRVLIDVEDALRWIRSHPAPKIAAPRTRDPTTVDAPRAQLDQQLSA